MLLLAVLGSTSVLINGVQFTPDSTNFIVAAQNLLEHGSFFVYSNWPSKTLLPAVEPYTDYPPGFALYLCPFLFLLKDPVLAATVAQFVAICFLFGALTFLMNVLRWNLILRAAGYLFFTCLSTFPVIYGSLFAGPLFIGLSLLGGSFALLASGSGSRPFHWLAASVCFALAVSVKVIGIFNLAWFVVPIMGLDRGRIQRAGLLMVCCTAPILLWFLRNKLSYGQVSFSHHIGDLRVLDTLLRPVHFLTQYLFTVAGSILLAWCVLLAVSFVTFVAPFLERVTKNGTRSMWKLNFVTNRPQHAAVDMQFTLVLVTIAHLGGIWGLSLFTHFSELDDRLLATSISMWVVAALNGVSLLTKRAAVARWRWIILASPFVFLLVTQHAEVPSVGSFSKGLMPLPEQQLWEDLRSHHLLEGTSHFYSDRNFKHQVFAHIPHRIFWDPVDVDTVEEVQVLAGSGEHPFFVFDQGSPAQMAFDVLWRTEPGALQKRTYVDSYFVVYHANRVKDNAEPSVP